MSDLTNPKQFAEAFAEVDATNEPEAIHNMIDQDIEAEKMHSKAGNTYVVEGGEFKKVEG